VAVLQAPAARAGDEVVGAGDDSIMARPAPRGTFLALVAVALVAGGGVAAALMAGCRSGPHAPALSNEPVYQNSQEGFRFLAPETWTQYAKAALPPGKVDKERLLVGYRCLPPDKPAQLEVSRADLPPDTNLTEYLGKAAFSSDKWRVKGAPEEVSINGVLAVRTTLVARSGREEMVREVVAFRRGERVYFFSGLYPAGDTKAREEIRRSVGSVIWRD
jgi:hypothetical protein